MCKSASILLVLIISVCISSLALPATKKKFSCWTNKQGIRECGNVLPPEYAQKGHEEMSAQGTVIKKVKRALTKEEIAAQQQLEENKLQQQKLNEEQKQRDATLMQTYNNLDEIEMAKKGKLISIDTELGIFSKNLKHSKQQLQALQSQAARSERNGKAVPEQLLKDIEKAKKQMDDYQQFIDKKNAEKERINAQFETDIQRFRALHSGSVAR